MINVRAPLVALLVFASTPALAGQLYKWVDSEGKVHYTDAPPDKGKVLNHSKTSSTSGGDENHCQMINRVAEIVADAMQQGVPAEEIHAILRAAEAKSGGAFNLDPGTQQQIVGYIYGFKLSRTSPSVIAGNVQNRCLNGVYTSPRKPKQAPEEQPATP